MRILVDQRRRNLQPGNPALRQRHSDLVMCVWSRRTWSSPRWDRRSPPRAAQLSGDQAGRDRGVSGERDTRRLRGAGGAQLGAGGRRPLRHQSRPQPGQLDLALGDARRRQAGRAARSRGIALSTPAGNSEPDFDRIAPYVQQVLECLLRHPDLPLVNVNFPRDPKGLRWTRQSVRYYDGAWCRGTIRWAASTSGSRCGRSREPKKAPISGRCGRATSR